MTNYDLSPERKPNETFTEYRERRRYGRIWLKNHLKGRQLWDSVKQGIARSAKKNRERSVGNPLQIPYDANARTVEDGSATTSGH